MRLDGVPFLFLQANTLSPGRIYRNIWCRRSTRGSCLEQVRQARSDRQRQQFLHQHFAGLWPVLCLWHGLLQDDLVISAKSHLAGLARNPGNKLFRAGKFIVAEGSDSPLGPASIRSILARLLSCLSSTTAIRLRTESGNWPNLSTSSATSPSASVPISMFAMRFDTATISRSDRQHTLGYAHLEPEIELWRPFSSALAAVSPLRAASTAWRSISIKLDPDLTDMTRLLITQKVAGTTDVHVVGSKGKAGTKRIQCLHDFQTAARLGCQQPVRIDVR